MNLYDFVQEDLMNRVMYSVPPEVAALDREFDRTVAGAHGVPSTAIYNTEYGFEVR